jgi:Domain of unknown function (DUF4153)
MGERLALGVVVSAAALGALGDYLFQGRPIGLNAGVFALAFVGALAILLRVGRIPLHQGRRAMVAPLLLFAGLLAWHDSPLLLATNLLAVAGAVALGALRRTKPALVDAQVTDYVVGAAAAGASTFAGAIDLLEKEVPWERIGRQVRGRQGAAVARGLAIGVPLLALFGGLFVAADAVFRSLLFDSIEDLRHLWLHLLIAGGIAWLSCGLLRDLLATRDEQRLVAAELAGVRTRRPALSSQTEVAIVLAIVNIVFAAFVAVQIRYLFGGRGLVESRLQLTYAQYARHGFFELLAVSLLVLPLLFGAHALLRHRSPFSLRLVQALSALLIALSLVVMASALQRLRLYQREYGLTELRLYATGLIIWLGFVFVWLAATVVRARPRLFVSGALVSGFVATLALNIANPDALIARTNLDRPRVDVAYLANLSDDAVPVLLARLPSLPPRLRVPLAQALLRRHDDPPGLAGWSASRSRARELLREQRATLVALGRGGNALPSG